MEIYIQESGGMIKLMGKDVILRLMELNMKENGKMIYNMDMVLRYGLIIAGMNDTTAVAKNTDLVVTAEETAVNMQGSGLITK